jgi:steroid 5-alpha reductase family enzyme
VGLWAARLGWHLFRRNRREGEDPRYARWREEHGQAFWWVSLFKVFWLQAGILWVVAWPLLVSVTASEPTGWVALGGAAVFLSGFLTEAVADAQLRAFRADPANQGEVLDTGLWRYSRHPNYFGNAVLWWGLWLLAVDAGGWWTVFSPVVMTFLLLKVSGVSLLEEDIEERRPAYAEYVRRTSAFVPMPPKSPENAS